MKLLKYRASIIALTMLATSGHATVNSFQKIKKTVGPVYIGRELLPAFRFNTSKPADGYVRVKYDKYKYPFKTGFFTGYNFNPYYVVELNFDIWRNEKSSNKTPLLNSTHNNG